MDYQQLRKSVIAELDDALGRVDPDTLTEALDLIVLHTLGKRRINGVTFQVQARPA